MSSEIPVFLTKALLILIVVSVAVANARPSHFGENNQVKQINKQCDISLFTFDV